MTTRNDVYIAVVGVIGVGKSEFIRLCTGQETGVASKLRTGTRRSTYTTRIRAWPFTHQGKRIHLIDTPGLNEFHTARDYDNLDTWLKRVGPIYQSGVELSGIILLLSVAEDPATRLCNQDFIFVERCCNENPLSRTILATTGWHSVSHEKGLRHESDLKRIAQSISKTRFDDSNSVRLYHTKHSCLPTLDMLLQQITSDNQDRPVEKIAKQQGEINASKQKITSSKKAQATDKAEEKRHRSDHATATKYKEEINVLLQKVASLEHAYHTLNVENGRHLQAVAAATKEDINALEQQISNLEKANQALSAENGRHVQAIAVATDRAAETREHEKQIASLTAELDEKTKEVAALKAYIAEAECTATGYWGDVEIPPIPYSLEPPRQAND